MKRLLEGDDYVRYRYGRGRHGQRAERIYKQLVETIDSNAPALLARG